MKIGVPLLVGTVWAGGRFALARPALESALVNVQAVQSQLPMTSTRTLAMRALAVACLVEGGVAALITYFIVK